MSDHGAGKEHLAGTDETHRGQNGLQRFDQCASDVEDGIAARFEASAHLLSSVAGG